MAAEGTKQLIFRHSVDLFSEHGFDSVSMKMIAKACGIQSSSIYNHFASKEALLDHIYDYYMAHCHDAKLDWEICEAVLRRGSPEDIMQLMYYPMADEAEGAFTLFKITRIVFGRLFVDKRASDVYRDCIITEGMDFAVRVLQAGREMGRIDMDEADLPTVAMIILSSRAFGASAAVADPDQPRWRSAEQQMKGWLVRTLVFRPPLL